MVERPQDALQVKTVANKKLPAVGDINSFDHLVSRDFGYKNSITLSVVRRDRQIDPAEMARLLNLDKAHALKDLLPKINDPLVKLLYGKVYRLPQHIWGLKGQRLGLYAKIQKLKKTWFGFSVKPGGGPGDSTTMPPSWVKT